MNCKKCGYPLTENDQFCKNCGASVNEVNAQNNVGNLANEVNAQNNVGNLTNEVNAQDEFNQEISPILKSTPMQEQSINNYQQPMNGYQSNHSPQPIYNQRPKNNNAKPILIGIGVAVLGAIVLFLVLGKSNTGEILGTGSKNNDGSIVNTNSTYKVKFKGFTFKIPTNLVYEQKEDYIIVGNEEDTWATMIEVFKGSFNQLQANKSQIQSNYQRQGYIASEAIEKTLQGVNYITVELSKNGANYLIGYAKANSMNVIVIDAFNIDNEFDYDLLKKMSSIISTAEFDDTTNNISTFEKIDMRGISELAQ